ncbi:flagellar protein FlgN [Microbacterium album]|uniref:WXG100 family type VII secretion target n=1 Tax=Microbacterium album TaxID=2053191 RepID=A0A917MLI6_9MICO|nr:flagellar protein FlgN [Microbacterium album]GGH42912.1 hypothetical protein GCM10010921_16440 [Microbacterium album]
MPDVKIDFDTMGELERKLGRIIAEFQNASGRADDLAAAIGSPYGRSGLRERSRDFEDRWEDKRKELVESLEKIQEHVQNVVQGFRDGDAELATQLSTE